MWPPITRRRIISRTSGMKTWLFCRGRLWSDTSPKISRYTKETLHQCARITTPSLPRSITHTDSYPRPSSHHWRNYHANESRYGWMRYTLNARNPHRWGWNDRKPLWQICSCITWPSCGDNSRIPSRKDRENYTRSCKSNLHSQIHQRRCALEPRKNHGRKSRYHASKYSGCNALGRAARE